MERFELVIGAGIMGGMAVVITFLLGFWSLAGLPFQVPTLPSISPPSLPDFNLPNLSIPSLFMPSLSLALVLGLYSFTWAYPAWAVMGVSIGGGTIGFLVFLEGHEE